VVYWIHIPWMIMGYNNEITSYFFSKTPWLKDMASLASKLTWELSSIKTWKYETLFKLLTFLLIWAMIEVSLLSIGVDFITIDLIMTLESLMVIKDFMLNSFVRRRPWRRAQASAWIFVDVPTPQEKVISVFPSRSNMIPPRVPALKSK